MAINYLLTSSAVFTANDLVPHPGCVAIDGNQIASVGPIELATRLRGPKTKVIECGDRLVMPGFNDSHLHFALASVQNDPDFCVDLMFAKSEAECVERVTEFAMGHPGTSWIYGQGWYPQDWDNPVDPSRRSLDATGIDRPICLSDFSMHMVWLNSKALKLLGITRETADPIGGVIRRDPDGEPTGILCEPPATNLALDVVLNVPNLDASLMKTMERFKSLGITAVGDMYPRGVACEDVYGTYQRMADAGESTLRITFFPDLRDVSGAQVERRLHNDDLVRCGGLKLIMDGAVEAYTAYMHDPYLDAPAGVGYRGECEMGQEELDHLVEAADAAGFSPRIHAIGDAAATMIIDAYERAIAVDGHKGTRFVIEHIDNIRLNDLQRMGRLGISAAIQPQHPIGGFPQGMYEKALGKNRTSRMWRYREALDCGVTLGLGTDWPAVMSINPIDTIYAAVTRSSFDGTPAEGYFRENVLTLGEALQAHTLGSAYVEGFDHKIGTLEEGKLADLVVLNCNPFDMDPLRLREVQVDMTIFNGEVIFER